MQKRSSVCAALAGGLLLFALGVTACGDDDDSSPGAGGAAAGGDKGSGGSGDQTASSGAGNEGPLGGAASGGAALGGAASGGAGAIPKGCPGPIIAGWKAGGKTYLSSTGLFVPLDELFNFTLVACSPAGDATVQFEMIPMLAVGTYPLTFKILHGMSANGDGGAFLSTGGSGKNYFTDDAHTGTFEITEVDDAAKTWSADFEFTGVADDDTTLEITEGHITRAPFSP